MASRVVLSQVLSVAGKPINIKLIQNPTIEDVVSTEVEIQASSIEKQDGSADNRRVDRDVRDFLIRLGIDR